jgi:hypothetical protein
MRGMKLLIGGATIAFAAGMAAESALANHRPGHNPPGLAIRGETPHGPKSWSSGEVLPPGLGIPLWRWTAFGLWTPPPGHQWVRVGGQFLLIVIETRIIVRVILL